MSGVQTVCFTGHRPEKLGGADIGEIKRRLAMAVEKAVRDGYTRFISGMSRGVDMWAARCVLDAKLQYPHIELECAVPYNGQQRSWCEAERREYFELLAAADVVTCLNKSYTKTCMSERNAYMVSRSQRLIACYDGKTPGGTANTVSMARRAGIEIESLLED